MARTGEERAVGEDGKEGEKGSGWKTPFELEAARMGIRYPGGKIDEWVQGTGVTVGKWDADPLAVSRY